MRYDYNYVVIASLIDFMHINNVQMLAVNIIFLDFVSSIGILT